MAAKEKNPAITGDQTAPENTEPSTVDEPQGVRISNAVRDETPPENNGFHLTDLMRAQEHIRRRNLGIENGEIDPNDPEHHITETHEGNREFRHPNEKPVQPIGSTRDVTGMPFHGSDPEADRFKPDASPSRSIEGDGKPNMQPKPDPDGAGAQMNKGGWTTTKAKA